MKMTKLLLPALAGTSLFFASALTHAQTAENLGLYVGGAYGVASVNDSEFDDDDTVIQGFVGLQLSPYLGIEGGYMDLGKHGGDLLRSDIDGYSLSVTGTLPLTDSFSLFVKGGQLWWDSKVSAAGFSSSYDGEEWIYGVGMNFAMTERLDFRLTYDRVDVDLEQDEVGPVASGDFDSEIDIVSAGLRFRF